MARLKLLVLVTLVSALVFPLRTDAQMTEITYQGQLQSSSAPANDNFDFEFLLFDALMSGSQIGATIPKSSVAVANGIFSVKLDFGSNFPGANRFIEIHVKQTGAGAFVTLSPRQAVSSTPYAIKSLSADTATNATNATNATTATNATQLGGIAASQYVQTNGNGSGLTNLNAGNIATGTLNNDRLGLIPIANIADAAVTSPKIASGQVVKSLNTLKDDVTLAAGSNITISPAGNTLTIASTSGGGNISGSGTTNSIPFWSSGTTLGSSLITQSAAGVQLPNGVQLGVGAQGNRLGFGSPNGETGMTISGAVGRSDLRFDGSTLKLVAGPAGSIPPLTNGIAISTSGDVGIGSAPSGSAKLTVSGGFAEDGLSVDTQSGVGLDVVSGTGTALLAHSAATAYAARLLGKIEVEGNVEITQPGKGIILRSPDGGTCQLLSIDNVGTLISSPITCPFAR